MTDFHTEKELVLQFYKELDAATENELHSVLTKYTTEASGIFSGGLISSWQASIKWMTARQPGFVPWAI